MTVHLIVSFLSFDTLAGGSAPRLEVFQDEFDEYSVDDVHVVCVTVVQNYFHCFKEWLFNELRKRK